MIPQTGELYRPARNSFEIRRGLPPEDVLDERLKFVKAMRWFPEQFSDDRDEYDGRDDTYHFTRRSDDGSVIAAMRLTPVAELEDALSYDMMSANPDLQSAVKYSPELAGIPNKWDLTRLVFPLDDSHDNREVADAIIELFGMAARVSAGEIDRAEDDVEWLFTTTPWMIRFFKQTGIKNKILAAGKLPDADGKQKTTLFCSVDIASAIESLRSSEKHQATYAHLHAGANKVERGVLHV